MAIKNEIDDFIKLIKEEFMAYEDYEELFFEWKQGFNKLLRENKISNKNLKKAKGKTYFQVYDETEIFSIADDFVVAYEENDLKSYFRTFE